MSIRVAEDPNPPPIEQSVTLQRPYLASTHAFYCNSGRYQKPLRAKIQSHAHHSMRQHRPTHYNSHIRRVSSQSFVFPRLINLPYDRSSHCNVLYKFGEYALSRITGDAKAPNFVFQALKDPSSRLPTANPRKITSQVVPSS